MTNVAVVILNYNGEKYLRQFLPSVISNSPEAEVYVADNNSSDGSVALLKGNFPEVKLIQLAKNNGYAGGYNDALQQIEASYYLLLNSDVEVSANWLAPLLSFLDNNKAYVAVQPKILSYNKKTHFEYAGAAGGFMDKLGYPYCRGRVFDTLEEDLGQYDDIIDIFWCSGACFLIRSKNFHSIGGFDASFFAHMEEIDLCWRLGNAGFKLANIPESCVYHVGGATLNKTNPNKTFLNFRNNLITLTKNLPLSQLFWILPIRIILDWIAALQFWKSQSFHHAYAIIRAQFAFFIKLNTTLDKRQKSTGRVNLKKLVLYSYFIRKRKTYSSINNTK